MSYALVPSCNFSRGPEETKMNAETDRAAPGELELYGFHSCPACMSFDTLFRTDALICKACGTYTKRDDTETLKTAGETMTVAEYGNGT